MLQSHTKYVCAHPHIQFFRRTSKKTHKYISISRGVCVCVFFFFFFSRDMLRKASNQHIQHKNGYFYFTNFYITLFLSNYLHGSTSDQKTIKNLQNRGRQDSFGGMLPARQGPVIAHILAIDHAAQPDQPFKQCRCQNIL